MTKSWGGRAINEWVYVARQTFQPGRTYFLSEFVDLMSDEKVV
jgi:hypothetical protein